MADFWLSHFEASYRFVSVDRTSGAELEVLDNVRGKSISRNQDTDTFETASIEYIGNLDIGNNLIRIYLDATDSMTGERVSEALGTYNVEIPKAEFSGSHSDSTANLYGRLKELYQDDFDSAYTIEAGANAVDAAAAIAEDAGLTVVADSSDYALTTPWTFGIASSGEDSVDSKLAAINQLLDAAGFSSAQTDPYGRILFKKYVEPSKRASSFTFEEGENARFMRSSTIETNEFDIANVVHVDYSTQDLSVRGTAENNDAASRYSTANRPRKVARYQYSDLPEGLTSDEDATSDETLQKLQEYANAKALELLNTNSSVKHVVTFKSIYRPLSVGDAITLKVPSWNISEKFAIRTISLDLSHGCVMSIEARYFER